MKPMKRKNFYLTEKQLKKLSAEYKRTGMSEAEIVRRALDEYFRKKK